MGDIISVINTLSQNIYAAVDNDVFKILDQIVFLDETFMKNEIFKAFEITNNKNLIIILSSVFVTILLIGFAIHRFVSMYNSNDSIIPSIKFIFKLTICIVVMTYSYEIIEIILEYLNKFTDLLFQIGKDITGKSISFVELKEMVINLNLGEITSAISLDGAIKGLISFGAVTLLLYFCVRYVSIIILCLFLPIAIIFLSSNITRNIGVMWIKNLLGLLFMQNIVQCVLILPFSVNANNTIFKIVLVGCIYILYNLKNIWPQLFNSIKLFEGNGGG